MKYIFFIICYLLIFISSVQSISLKKIENRIAQCLNKIDAVKECKTHIKCCACELGISASIEVIVDILSEGTARAVQITVNQMIKSIRNTLIKIFNEMLKSKGKDAILQQIQNKLTNRVLKNIIEIARLDFNSLSIAEDIISKEICDNLLNLCNNSISVTASSTQYPSKMMTSSISPSVAPESTYSFGECVPIYSSNLDPPCPTCYDCCLCGPTDYCSACCYYIDDSGSTDCYFGGVEGCIPPPNSKY